MPATLTYPGVYIEEIPSGVRTITGVATSVTAFIGRTRRGPTDRPRLVQSFAEFDRLYVGLWVESTLSYAGQQDCLNGGRDALIVRVQSGGGAATLAFPGGYSFAAASEGEWGRKLRVRAEAAPAGAGEAADSRFNLLVKDTGSGVVERYLNLSTDPNHSRYLTRVLTAESNLIRSTGAIPAARPTASGAAPAGVDPLDDNASSTAFAQDGGDGNALTDASISSAALEAPRQGIWQLDHADLFNLLCIPPLTR